MAITYSVGKGSYIRPLRNARLRRAPEAASQTFRVGDVLIMQTSADKGNQVKISAADPTAGTAVGIAMQAASGVEGSDVVYAPLDEQAEFYIHVGDTQTLDNDDLSGVEYGIVADSTNQIWRLDNTESTAKVFRVIDFATNPQTGVVFAHGDVNGAYIVRSAYAVQAKFKS